MAGHSKLRNNGFDWPKHFYKVNQVVSFRSFRWKTSYRLGFVLPVLLFINFLAISSRGRTRISKFVFGYILGPFASFLTFLNLYRKC